MQLRLSGWLRGTASGLGEALLASFKVGRFFWASRSCNHQKRRHLAMAIPNWLDEQYRQNGYEPAG